MDQRVQCPVCTLFLHSGMSLESHLDTHPKDQVIKALCSLSAKNVGSRTPTPSTSERSFRSRTPATDDSVRWSSSRRSAESGYWRRTPSRNKSSSSSNISRNVTPDIRIGGINFENNAVNSCGEFSECAVKSTKSAPVYTTNVEPPQADFNTQFPFYPDSQDDPEIKYSRSTDYSVVDNSNPLFPYNLPVIGPTMKMPPTMLTPHNKRANNIVKLVPKQNNMLMKNIGGLRYITPNVKPYPVMMSAAPSFMQKNVQTNMMMAGNMPVPDMLEPKAGGPMPAQFNQMSADSLSSGTTVVTQNSQIIYREMVHNMDGKPYISNMPHMLSTQENMAQSSSMYQNVMVVDQFGNASCMYNTPPPLIPKPCNPPMFGSNLAHLPNTMDKSIPNIVNDANKTLIIEVSPMLSTNEVDIPKTSADTLSSQSESNSQKAIDTDTSETKISTAGSCKGLKILSNIKVEVPVQHHKNMINTVMDLTGPGDSGYIQRPSSPEKILPDLDEKPSNISDDCTQASNSSGDNGAPHSFSVIKNVGNPQTCKEFTVKQTTVKLDIEFSDSCPVPDLICNEKPSISPCSELLDHGENSMDRCSPITKSEPSPKPENCSKNEAENDYVVPAKRKASVNIESLSPKSGSTSKQELAAKNGTPSPKPQPSPVLRTESSENNDSSTNSENKKATKTKNFPLRLNNIFVKKHKKVLKIKNLKPLQSETDPQPSSSSKAENFFGDKPQNFQNVKDIVDIPLTVGKTEINDNKKEFDADTEEQSMDIEPIAPSTISHSNNYTTTIDLVHIKEEANSSNEFTNEMDRSNRDLTPLESLRPINVITYGNMGAADFDDDSNHRELLDLETASKNKQFVNMMNDNYFGDNIYADYFTPDRVESFDVDKESNLSKGREEMYHVWGEPSQKENEFVLPNFIHESYKIAESNMDYDVGESEHIDTVNRVERDSKVDLLTESRSEEEPPLNICTDERMPPRGELSGQESNGDMESPWSGMYPEVTPAEPYDLIARESWVSDGSDIDTTEKRDNLEEDALFTKTRLHTCTQCGLKFPTLKELRSHCNASYSHGRVVTSRAIKKEEKPDEGVLEGNLLYDSKESVATTMLQAYDTLTESKPELRGLIKREKKKKRNFVCPTCKVDQGNDVDFNNHLKIHPLECQTCGKCFYRRANLALHIKTHLGIKNYKCEICQKRFITRQKLNEHRNVHTGHAPVKCTVCDDTFRRYSNMVQHRDRHHLNKKAKVRDYICQCGAVFHSRAKLHWHRETHDGRPKACAYCSDKFVHAASLTRHVRRTHNEYYLSPRLRGKVDNVTCPVCKQVYLRTNLRAHLLTHSGKRPYPCIICNKAFTTKWNLKLHRWTHTSRSAKPYKCALCKGAFVRHAEYVAHMNAHKSVRPYTCNYCGCQFIRKYNCQRHVREHETAKKYVCKVPECGKSFHRSYYLSEHMKVHSGVRPFACNICGKTSSNKSNHNKHVKIHHAREPVATEA
ncbi:uncharacterized protein LOC123694909 [Colias croceus]|uniref:uncharacterized protein LOC123694909 n=1 Tax=Colias crocea TaxID=72248 RepID=UPI001E27BB21|nr:uncharacterized protein LOC123694909 [Colias croceus]